MNPGFLSLIFVIATLVVFGVDIFQKGRKAPR